MIAVIVLFTAAFVWWAIATRKSIASTDVAQLDSLRQAYQDENLRVESTRVAPGAGKGVRVNVDITNDGDRPIEDVLVRVHFYNRSPLRKDPDTPIGSATFRPLGKDEHIPPETTAPLSHETKPPKQWDGVSVDASVVSWIFGDVNNHRRGY